MQFRAPAEERAGTRAVMGVSGSLIERGRNFLNRRSRSVDPLAAAMSCSAQLCLCGINISTRARGSDLEPSEASGA